MSEALNPRAAAADLLIEVLEHRRALEDALGASARYNALEGRDRAFARALAGAALRALGGIDQVLGRYLQKPLEQAPPPARALLRVGAAQILALDTPAHAAVGETVAAARAISPGSAGLVNAVLRRLAESGREAFAALPAGAHLPAWLFTRWRAAYGGEAEAIARAIAVQPPLDLSVKAAAADWAERLGGAVTRSESVRLSAHGPVETLDGYESGAWWVQDAAAALPARLLGDVRGLIVADLCAAPGGKTMQLAAAGAQVTAVDRDAARLATVQANLARTRLEATLVRADVRKLKARAPFDAALLDAPCTATGTLRRHPDVAWLRRPDDVRTLAALQAEMLAAAAGFVKPGGTLVYAVCSLEPEEGEGQIAAALASGTWVRAPLSAEEFPFAADFITPDGDLRTLPSHWSEIGGLDGFYASRLTRSSAG